MVAWKEAIGTYSTSGRLRKRGGIGSEGGTSMIEETGEMPGIIARDGEFLGPTTSLACTNIVISAVLYI